jgi:hypothetical protein
MFCQPGNKKPQQLRVEERGVHLFRCCDRPSKIPSFGKLMLLDAQDILACADGHLTLFA